MPAEKDSKELTSETSLTDSVKLVIKTEIDKLESISKDQRGIQDPKIIHDIRVSARRLQTILESIGEILPANLLNKGKFKLKEITKALGKTRENDVSIKLIEKFIKKEKKKSGKNTLLLLLARLQNETKLHRKEAFRDSKVIDEISYLKDIYLMNIIGLNSKSFRVIDYLNNAQSLKANGLLVLPRLYDRVVRLAKTIMEKPEENNSDELHKMRIKAKPLRYMMEFFGFVYGEDFAQLVKEVKNFVEMLGEIHDKDVLIAQLLDFREEITIFNKSAEKGKMNLSLVDKFIKMLSNKRLDEFKEVKQIFDVWIDENFRDKMILSLS
jgi:CHAD domain-containing protein